MGGHAAPVGGQVAREMSMATMAATMLVLPIMAVVCDDR